ncbi:DUF1776 domain-containing protein [Planctomonas sp. JC2975]|nr:DUF1776 domain-containing protein [Planctomonas sp. JC2975]
MTVLREVVIVTASPTDPLVHRFARDLRRRGLPHSTLAGDQS